MKIIGLVGSNAELSYNRKLLQFIGKEYKDLFHFEVVEIKDLPLFNQDEDATETVAVQTVARKISRADGVIIATPEHNHTITAALKSALEWLSFNIHPFENKPTMVVGASYYDQGSSRAQLHLRQILDAPGVNAMVFPGNEFLLGKVKEAFDERGNITDQRTKDYLRTCLEKFTKFVQVVSELNGPKTYEEEDLWATGSIATTIDGVDKSDPEWVEKAAALVGAAEGNDYVKLDRGILTVDQLNMFLKSMPMELTYADDNNQFLYYNRVMPGEEMLASRYEKQVGYSLAECHPERARKGAEKVIQMLRAGDLDVVRIPITHHGPDKYVVHNYQAMHYPNGDYAGINEYILDFKPIVEFYLKNTGQKLVPDDSVDATSSASTNDSHGSTDAATATDATSSASTH